MNHSPLTEGIIAARHMVERDAATSHASWIAQTAARLVARKDLEAMPIMLATGAPILARLDWQRWSARCDFCTGSEYVDPTEKIFFCFSCANKEHGHHLRPVIFPPRAERLEIEALVMERPVREKGGATRMARAMNAVPVRDSAIIYSRSWMPGETADDLQVQNNRMRATIKKRGGRI